MNNIDSILENASRELFGKLDEIDYNILRKLAEDGPQNLTKLGRSSRKNRRKRLNGSTGMLGLIPNGFVHGYKINKKENNFDLTLKGLLAVFATNIKFEEVDIVKKYKAFLSKRIKKKKLLNWSLDFIKYEIALILHYNYLQGLDWTKFKNIKPYWTDYKLYSDNVRKTFFMHEFLNKDITEEYKIIERKYLTLFSILDYCTFPIKWGIGKGISEFSQFVGEDPIRIYLDRWYLFIDDRNLRDQDVKMLMIEWDERRENNILDIDEFFDSKLDIYKTKAKDILKRNGYEIVIPKPGPYSI